ncbi:MAG TPA: hypothetical protein VFF68_12360 [Anaerolineaceae bacterium]|nr:hypothetical protein [Anaerolineaceae bacterium]
MFGKFVIGFVLVMMLLCVGTAVVGVIAYRAAVETEPEQVSLVGETITAFALPGQFEEHYAVQFAGYSVMEATTPAGNSHIFLAQAPRNALFDLAGLPGQVAALDRNWETSRPARLRTVGQVSADVRGEQVPFVISEGVNSDGEIYRQMTALFSGRGGDAMVNISAPVSEWDQAAVDAFITSLD